MVVVGAKVAMAIITITILSYVPLPTERFSLRIFSSRPCSRCYGRSPRTVPRAETVERIGDFKSYFEMSEKSLTLKYIIIMIIIIKYPIKK